MKNNKIIIFDFDGVIADSLQLGFEVNLLSKPTLTLERYQALFDDNINKAEFEDEVVREIDFFEEYRPRFAELGIDEQKKMIIKNLAQEFPLFIVSSNMNDIINDYLERHEISHCFSEVLGNDTNESKVEKFKMLFDKNNINPQDVVFITDSTGDMKEAQEVNIQTIIGILGGFQNEASLKTGNPNLIVKDLTEFYEFLQT